MKASTLSLRRSKTEIFSRIKKASKSLAFVSIGVFLLIAIIALKTYKTELGYKLTQSKTTYSEILIKNKKLRSQTLQLKSHQRIESIAKKNNMKFPNQRDVIKINNE